MSGNKKAVFKDLTVKHEVEPEQQIIRVNLFDSDNNLLIPNDADARVMSQQYPDQKCLTVYHNGIPEVYTVKQLIKETMLQIQGEVEA
jgi:hypothetical protein